MDLADRLASQLGDRYAIDREIGRGGMAVVYRAQDTKHGRQVAIKVLRPELSASLGAERFLREIQIAAGLQHPHILPLYDSGDADGLLYYVMPFVEGESLRERVTREKQLPLGDALAITRDIAKALSHAHSMGVVHRDIKPENVLLTGDHAIVADFGIARALSAAGGEALTDSGVAIGTPAYMSPEQAAGSPDVDPRTDIYALGCVLYEMLVGEPPFTGPTAQAVIARHVSQDPPSVRVVRPSTPEPVIAAIETALAKVPADRFSTAQEFADSLKSGDRSRRSLERISRRSRRGPWIVAAAALAVIVGAIAVVPRLVVGTRLDPSHYLLAPLSGGTPATRSAQFELMEHSLYNALRQVPDVTIEESARVIDWKLRAGGTPSLDDWSQAARGFAAGKMIALEALELGDSTHFVADLYDVSSGRRVGGAEVRLAAGAVNAVPELAARLATALFDLPEGAILVSGSSVEEAARAFAAGKVAVDAWDLRVAKTRLSDAVELDPEFTQARYWLAQVEAWAGDSAYVWLPHARYAAAKADVIGNERDAVLARALLALAEEEYGRACELYGSVAAADSLNFAAWFGLAQCHQLNRNVAPDTASPSRWSFESGFETAADAYRRALELVPSFNFVFEPYARLDRLLFTAPNQVRTGRAVAPDTGLFAAWPSLVDDTLAFVPFRIAAVFRGDSGTFPSTHREALLRNQRTLVEILRPWARAFPDSSGPYVHLAEALEATGDLEGEGQPDRSALGAAQRARQLIRDADDRLRAATTEVRLLVKVGRFEAARELAEVHLRAREDVSPSEASDLAGLAALLGHPNRAADLLVIAGPSAFGPLSNAPAPVQDLRARLYAYAATGAPVDSIGSLALRMDSLLLIHVVPRDAEGLRCLALAEPLSFAYPEVGWTTNDSACLARSYLLQAQLAASNGDGNLVRTYLAQVDTIRHDLLPGEVSIGSVYQEAWLLLQVGDTLAATQRLDASLGALRAMSPNLVPEVRQAAGLVRAMALRADIAAALSDTATARRWAAPVVTLWGDATPELQPLVERMHDLSRAGTN